MPITMPTRSASALAAVLIASVAACGDTIEPPLQRDAIRIEGSVVDAAGAPLAGAFAVLLVGTSIKELPSPGDAPYAVTASDGGYAVTQSALTGAVDSVMVEVYPPGCAAPPSRVTLGANLLPADPDTPVEMDVIADPVSARARTELGEVCAAGAEPFWGVRSYMLILRIKSIEQGVVSGGWGVYFQRTSVGPEGSFEGVLANGLLVLNLEPDQASAAACGGARLVIPVGAEGEWGAADISVNEGCIPASSPLTFARSAVP